MTDKLTILAKMSLIIVLEYFKSLVAFSLVQYSYTTLFNNHTSSSMTTHQFIERRLHVVAGQIATNTLDFF